MSAYEIIYLINLAHEPVAAELKEVKGPRDGGRYSGCERRLMLSALALLCFPLLLLQPDGGGQAHHNGRLRVQSSTARINVSTCLVSGGELARAPPKMEPAIAEIAFD